MPEVIVGPMLRYADETQATVWVETDEACEVEVLGFTEPTFCVEGHHYALVCIHDLEPGSENAYEVKLDGELAWPDPESDLPPPCIRTISEDTELRVSFGSCRMAVPHEPPHTHSQDEHDEGREVDALHVLAKELIRDPKSRWPNLLLLLGDQVYVDEGSPKTREFIRSRRDTSEEPGEEVLDFEEYTHLYRESWTDPLVRWLFSTIPTAMVIDDHDMSDDWNISRTWVEEMEQKEWWQKRLVAGFSTYWLYQHMGNLSPSELSDDRTWNEVRENREDATEVVMDYAHRAHHDRDWHQVELLPRPLPDARDRHGQPRRPRAREGPPLDLRRRGARLGLGQGEGRLRPSPHRRLRSVPPHALLPLARSLEREGRRGQGVGLGGVEARREDAPRRRLRPLVGVRLLVQEDDRVPPPRRLGRMG